MPDVPDRMTRGGGGERRWSNQNKSVVGRVALRSSGQSGSARRAGGSGGRLGGLESKGRWAGAAAAETSRQSPEVETAAVAGQIPEVL